MIKRKLKVLATRLMGDTAIARRKGEVTVSCGQTPWRQSLTDPGWETSLFPHPSKIANFPSKIRLLLIEALRKEPGNERGT